MLPVQYTNLSNQILVIAAGRAARKLMLEWIAAFAIQGAVTVVDGGNHFNVYHIAKAIRRKTVKLDMALANIHVSRSFSCYQMTALLEEMKPAAAPIFILDLLFSFYDEDVKNEESQRLLEKSILSLQRLSETTPVVISTRGLSDKPERQNLMDMLTDIAAAVWQGEEPAHQTEAPLTLPWGEVENQVDGGK